jgi:hypothetical protein
MTIINHGSWLRYVPEVWPKDVPGNVMFCRRDDGTDWYVFSRKLDGRSIWMTVHEGIVQAVSRDASMLFPQNCRLLEVVGDGCADPQAKYGGKLYDAKANSFGDRPPPVPQPDPLEELRARIAALEARR